MNFIIRLLIILISIIIIYLNNIIYWNKINYELFDTNLFYKPLNNIFLGNNYYNYKNDKYDLPDTTQNIQSLSQISYDSYLYSDSTSNKIICSNYINQADCWANNNCQWINNINGNSYCEVAPKWIL